MSISLKLKEEFSEFMKFLKFVEFVVNVHDEAKKKGKRLWVRDEYLDRDDTGFFATTYLKLKNDDPEQFRSLSRMSPEIFDCLYNLLKDKMTKCSSRAIAPDCRLFLTLYYLANGTSRQKLSDTFKMSVSVVRRIILETCEIIWKNLNKIYIGAPNNNEWKKIANDFNRLWDLPNCVGAIDGKHIALTSSSKYATNSIILLGVCDANYTFTAVDVNAYDSKIDVNGLNYTELGNRFFDEQLNLPPDASLPNSFISFPYYLIGNTTFPLKTFLMRPYPGHHLSDKRTFFNIRLLEGRRTIENTFGVLTARWKILGGTLNMSSKAAEIIVRATVLLHNFLKMLDETYCPCDYIDKLENGILTEGLWRKDIKPLKSISRFSSNNSTKDSFQLRDKLCEYFFLN